MSAASTEAGSTQTGRTAWARNMAAPVRDFLGTETGSAVVLLAAAVLALVWANSPWRHSYDSLWTTQLSIRVGGGEVAADLRHWVNQGLMTLFFLVVGLEAKRELDVGELRERSRVAIPALAAIGGMAVPVAIYLALQRRRRRRQGLGGGDVDRHGAGARRARAAHTPQRDAPARVPADARRGRRPDGA